MAGGNRFRRLQRAAVFADVGHVVCQAPMRAAEIRARKSWKTPSVYPATLLLLLTGGWRQRRAEVMQFVCHFWAALAACVCGLSLGSQSASAEVQLTVPSGDKVKQFDKPRDLAKDAGFARGMAYGMADYEQEASGKKLKLFQRLLSTLPREGATVVEVGMGSFPNAVYFGSEENAPRGMDLVGVDPNDSMELSMESFARESAQRAGLTEPGKKNSLRIVHGVAEALPLPSQCADAVVCTLTLCSVLDPAGAVAEIRRILKPGGKFLFHEHVLSETDSGLASQQKLFTPYQVIRAGGFRSVDAEYFDLKGFEFLNPTVEGSDKAVMSFKEQHMKNNPEDQQEAARSFNERQDRLPPIVAYFSRLGKLEKLEVSEVPKEAKLEKLVEQATLPQFAIISSLSPVIGGKQAELICSAYGLVQPVTSKTLQDYAASVLKMTLDPQQPEQLVPVLKQYAQSSSSPLIVLHGFPSAEADTAAFVTEFGQPKVVVNVECDDEFLEEEYKGLHEDEDTDPEVLANKMQGERAALTSMVQTFE
ncbi:unnamed protein product, partial [Polarella glacialis]